MGFEQKVAVKEASLTWRNELRVLLDTKGCRSKRVELCWHEGELLISAPPKVQFLAVGSTENEACTERVSEDVRVFSIEPVNRWLRHSTIMRCGLMQDTVLCALNR